MGKGTEENPYTREDVRRLIKENGDTAEGLDLSRKVFEGDIDLRGLKLQGIILKEAYLRRAHLEGADLTSAHLEGADLWEANLEGAHLGFANLEGAILLVVNLKRAYLADANLVGVALTQANLERANLFRANLEESYLRMANLEGAVLVNANLKGADLTLANLKEAYLVWAQFSADTEFAGTDWGDYILGEEKNGDFSLAKEAYWRLRHWHANAGLHDIAAKFYYREMEAKRKAQSWKKEPLSKLWYWVIKLLCGYGERYGNVVVAALVIIFGLAIVYIFGGLNLAYAIYFSAVSFTALGYGSWAHPPAGWIQGLGAAESFLGVFMMALFLVTFIRKMTR